MELVENAELSACNSFGFSVIAERFARVDSLSRLQALLDLARERDWPLLLLGGGSNLILKPFLPGLVLQPANSGWQLREEGKRQVVVEVAAGENWHTFVTAMLRAGYYGLENLALIPGNVGAAPIQNIGAYGVELADCLLELDAYDREAGALVTLTAAQCRFGYRDSIFKSACPGRYVIWQLRFALAREFVPRLGYQALRDALAGQRIAAPCAEDVFQAVVAMRQAKLPDPAELGNAGSFFENPVVPEATCRQLRQQFPKLVAFADRPGYMKLAAGWLIDQAGWKGRSRGAVGVYHKQALVLVNHGGGTAAELQLLADEVRASVREMFGIELCQEPRIYPLD